MEEAIYLTKFASKVTVVHRRDTLRASKIMQDKAFANPKIDFIWDSEVDRRADWRRARSPGIVLRNLKTGEIDAAPVEGVFIAIGHTPNTALFKGQIDLDRQRLHRSDERARARTFRACSPPATCRITSTARRSRRPAPAAWPRSTPSAISRGCPPPRTSVVATAWRGDGRCVEIGAVRPSTAAVSHRPATTMFHGMVPT